MARCIRYSLSFLLVLALVALGCQHADDATSAGSSNTNVVRVEPGPDAATKLQEALIMATAGDVVELAAGHYDFQGTLSLDVPDVTIRGAGHDQTIFSFKNQAAGTGGEGILITSDGVTIEDLAVEDTPGDGIKFHGVGPVTIRRVRAEWTDGPKTTNGAYGIYPVECRQVLVEDCVAIGASDAGIYVGQSKHVIVRRNESRRNVAGIEIENCTRADVYENVATDNTGGILVFSLPNLPAGGGSYCRVFDNEVYENNHANFALEGNIVAEVPPGTGMMVMAYDHVEIFRNTIRDNQTANLAVLSYLVTEKEFDDPDYDPYCQAIDIHDNEFTGGGDQPAGKLGKTLAVFVGGKFPDIIYDGIVDEEKLVDGALPSAMQIKIDGNGDADFANLDLANFDPLKFKLPKISRDLAPHAGRHRPLPPVELEPGTAVNNGTAVRQANADERR